MKIIIFILSLSFALNVFSYQTLISHQCAGIEDGMPFKVNLHIDERIFCSDTPEGPYVGALVFDKEFSLQELILGEVVIDSESADMRFVAKAKLESGEELEIMSLGGIANEAYELNMLINDSPIEYDTIQLTCTPIHYQMDC